ncbi:MAG: hypothetical protein N3A00_01405 [Thermodesulfovibrio sp.]|nr:hypothetical protein [Thermodesulfovibrio sp.]
MITLRIFLVLFVFLSLPCHAFDRKGFSPTSPFSVFSTFLADSPKQNQLAIDLGFDISREPDVKRINLNLSYGLTDKIEIIAGLPYVFKYSNAFDERGFEDINFGFKHRFIDETVYLPAVAYLVYVSGEIGNEKFSSEGGLGGGIIISKKIGPVKTHGNIIYFRPNREVLKETWNLNFGTELLISHNSKILFEIIGRKAIDRNKIDLLEWRLGYRIRITDFSYSTVGMGFDIKDRNPDMRFMFSISFVLPKEKSKIKKIVEDAY